MPTNYSLELSSAELRWLAGAFGMARLPFSLPAVTNQDLSIGHESLLKRSLIEHKMPGGWRIHPFLMLALQWLGSTSRYWLFYKYHPSGASEEALVLLEDKTALCVQPTKTGRQFFIYDDIDGFITDWQEAVGLLTPQNSDNIVEWDVPQPITVIRMNWKNPPLAKTMASTEFLTWAAKLCWVGEWMIVTEQYRFSRLALAMDGDSTWAGCFVPGKPGEFPLRTYQPAILHKLLLAGK